MRTVPRCTGRAVFLVMLALAAPGWGSPLDLFGFGGRSPGLAGTGGATTTDYDAVYLNPAGLADTPKKRITLGTMAGSMFLHVNDERTDTDAITGLVIGGALPVPLGGALRGRVGFGLGFHIPGAAINRARHPLPGEPVYVLLENRTQVVAIQGALGVKVNERWRVGLGALALAELRGTIDVTTDAAGRFTTFSEQQLLTRVAPILGARYLLSEKNIQIGMTLRGASRSDYDIVVTNDLGEALPLTLPTIHVAGTSQYDPLTAALEASWQWRPGVVLCGQLAYQRWSSFPRPTLSPVEGMEPLPEPGFRDIVVPRVAAEWSIAAGTGRVNVRGGYGFVLSPAPEVRGPEVLLDNHRHVAALGLGMGWPGTRLPLQIDAWVQMHGLVGRTHDSGATPDAVATGGAVVAGGVTMGVDL